MRNENAPTLAELWERVQEQQDATRQEIAQLRSELEREREER